MGHALMENRNGLIVGALTNPRFGSCRAPGGVGADRTAWRPAATDHPRRRQRVRPASRRSAGEGSIRILLRIHGGCRR